MSSRDLVVAAAGASAPSDPNFENVALLLTGDGTNGAQNNTFLDSSTNNFTITRNGNTTQGTFSPYGDLWSNYFDGSGDYLRVSYNSALDFGSSNFTIESFVYRVSTTDSGQICGLATGGPSGRSYYLVATTTPTFYWYYNGSTINTLTSSISISIGSWNHIAVVRNGSTITMYVNGVSAGSASISGSLYSNAASVFDIGQEAGYGTFFFNGYISNLRVVKGTALYTSNFTPSTTPLTAVSGTSLLTCQSNRFRDASSNNFTITVNGNTSVQRFSPFNPTTVYSPVVNGGSGYFDGTGDYLTIPDNAALRPPNGDFTYEIWWYPTSLSGVQEIFTKGAGVQIFLDGGLIKCALSSNNTTSYFIAASFGTPTLNAWNHIAVVRTGNTYYGYLNGIRTTLGTSASIPGTGTDNVVIGAYGAGQFPTFGYLSSARYTTSAVYTASPATVPTAPLTAITNTSLLCNFTNAGIVDATAMNDLETVGNAQVSTSVKKYGTGSLAFDGTGDCLTSINKPTVNLENGDFTVEGWFNPSNVSSDGMIVQKDWNPGVTYPQYGILIKGSKITGVIGNSSSAEQQLTGTTTLINGAWYHFAFTLSGTTLRLFLNGVLEASATKSVTITSSTAPLVVGSGGISGTTNPFNGYIDDLRITKGYARYTANFTPPAQALPTN